MTRSQRIALAMRGYTPPREWSAGVQRDIDAYVRRAYSSIMRARKEYMQSMVERLPEYGWLEAAPAAVTVPKPHTFSVYVRGPKGLPCS